MGTRSKWREQTIADLSRAGIPLPVTRKLLRYGATLHRLAEAQCNGDYPCNNGERKVVPCGGSESLGCGSYWVPGVLKGKRVQCPDCRTTELIKALCKEAGLTADIGGDPRGAVLTVKTKKMTEQDRGIFVA